MVNMKAHLAGRQKIPDIQQALPQGFFNFQTAADPERDLPEKILFIDIHAALCGVMMGLQTLHYHGTVI
jgi:hypothetical protein